MQRQCLQTHFFVIAPVFRGRRIAAAALLTAQPLAAGGRTGRRESAALCAWHRGQAIARSPERSKQPPDRKQTRPPDRAPTSSPRSALSSPDGARVASAAARPFQFTLQRQLQLLHRTWPVVAGCISIAHTMASETSSDKRRVQCARFGRPLGFKKRALASAGG